MKPAALVLISLTGLFALTTLAQESKQPAPAFPASKTKQLYAQNDLRGKKAPEFKVESWLNKEPDRKGKVVLIDFWATWCPPCRELVPELEGFKKKFKDDLVVIGVSDEKPETVKKFMEEKKISYAMAIDQAKTMKSAVGVEGIPHVLIVDSQGIVRWQGFPLSDEEKLTESIIKTIIDADKAAAKKAPADTSAPKKEDKPAEKKPDHPPAEKKPTGG
jgi:thiol-disulfide isomerase/thioredoxin